MFQDHYESQLNRFKESFLTEAAKCGRTEEVASLIELGARVDWSPQNEDTPLLIAVRNNHLDVATILIAHGADVERRGEGGNSALHLACYSGNEEMCALLLSSTSVSENNQACLAITSVNDEGLTPFDVAVEHGFWALGQTLKNMSDTLDDANSNFSDEEDGNDEIRDRFLAQGQYNSNEEIHNFIESDVGEDFSLNAGLGNLLPAYDVSGYQDEEGAVTWQHKSYKVSKNIEDELSKLRKENMLLRKAENIFKKTSNDAEKAILILEERCKKIAKDKKEFATIMDEVLQEDILGKKSLEEIEMIEKRIRSALDQVLAVKMSKISQQIENRSCVICQVEPKTVLFMPCRHLCVCKECSKNHQLISCPLCREEITERIDVYS